MEVIAFALSYLKNELKKSLDVQAAGVPGVCVNLEDFHWVITVPAIWTPQAKQMMREAACLVSEYNYNNTAILQYMHAVRTIAIAVSSYRVCQYTCKYHKARVITI